jgi:2-desacetyl-2-hydroxyethyl bacteriochlorophyllide A dehydrogenase
MRAAITQGTGKLLQCVDMPDPEPLAGELLVRITACGICGSDLHLSDALDFPGIVLGHEFAGEVVETGPDVEGWKVGDRLSGFPLMGCGHCNYCVAGATSKCVSANQLGLQRPGGFAQYTTLAATSAFRIPDSLDNHAGALVEPLAVAHHALEATRRDPSAPVLIIGGGPVGAAVALWARHLGAREVIVSDPVAHRRALAETVGATASIDPTTSDVATEFARIAGGAPDVVIECVGIAGMIQHAFDVAAIDAAVTIVGVCMTADELMPLTALQKELSAQFVLYYRKSDFTASINALASGALDAHALVTGSVSIDELPDRFQSLKSPTHDCKVMLEP